MRKPKKSRLATHWERHRLAYIATLITLSLLALGLAAVDLLLSLATNIPLERRY